MKSIQYILFSIFLLFNYLTNAQNNKEYNLCVSNGYLFCYNEKLEIIWKLPNDIDAVYKLNDEYYACIRSSSNSEIYIGDLRSGKKLWETSINSYVESLGTDPTELKKDHLVITTNLANKNETLFWYYVAGEKKIKPIKEIEKITALTDGIHTIDEDNNSSRVASSAHYLNITRDLKIIKAIPIRYSERVQGVVHNIAIIYNKQTIRGIDKNILEEKWSRELKGEISNIVLGNTIDVEYANGSKDFINYLNGEEVSEK